MTQAPTIARATHDASASSPDPLVAALADAADRLRDVGRVLREQLGVMGLTLDAVHALDGMSRQLVERQLADVSFAPEDVPLAADGASGALLPTPMRHIADACGAIETSLSACGEQLDSAMARLKSAARTLRAAAA